MTRRTSHFGAWRAIGSLAIAAAVSCANDEQTVGSQRTEPTASDAETNELVDTSWVTLGFYPGVGDGFLQAIADFTTMECCEYAVDDETFVMSTCVSSLFSFYAPRMQWLSCVSRLAEDSAEVRRYVTDLGEYIVGTDACYRLEACQVRPCEELSEPEPPAILADCPDRNRELCPDGNGFSNGVDCNGVNDCSDGYDERNCPPDPDGFLCGDGGAVPWSSLCDGTSDCQNQVDESTCFRTE